MPKAYEFMFTCTVKDNLFNICNRFEDYRQRMVHSFVIGEELYPAPDYAPEFRTLHYHVWFRMKCDLVVNSRDLCGIFAVPGGQLTVVRDSATTLQYVTKDGKCCVYARHGYERHALLARIKKLNSGHILWAMMDIIPEGFTCEATLVTGGQDSRELMFGTPDNTKPVTADIVRHRRSEANPLNKYFNSS